MVLTTWIPLGASAVLTLLGVLLGLPESIRRLGVFSKVPDIAATAPDLFPLTLVTLIAIAPSDEPQVCAGVQPGS